MPWKEERGFLVRKGLIFPGCGRRLFSNVFFKWGLAKVANMQLVYYTVYIEKSLDFFRHIADKLRESTHTMNAWMSCVWEGVFLHCTYDKGCCNGTKKFCGGGVPSVIRGEVRKHVFAWSLSCRLGFHKGIFAESRSTRRD